jgi:hypothetical protein
MKDMPVRTPLSLQMAPADIVEPVVIGHDKSQ